VTALSAGELTTIGRHLTEEGVELRGPLSAELIPGGRSNLTYRLTDGSSRWVLRMPPRSGRTPSAHDVAREHRVTRALRSTGVPVPTAVALCEDEDLIGAPFTVSSYVDGASIQTRTDLAALDDATLARVVDRLIETLAALHAVDHVAIGLETYGRPDGYPARQLKRWSSQWDIVAPADPEVRRAASHVMSALRRSVPEQRATSIVHGDFRIDNTILDLHGPPRVAAMVDWELSTIGDPVADMAMMCVYRHPALDLILGEQGAWTSDRMPDVATLAASYEAAGGAEPIDLESHLALASFKLAVIAAGIDHRYRTGATAGSGFDRAGESVPLLLEASRAHLAEGR
jgi:aminoglycoside phosphotransferase (APT) family kinase protein